MANEFYYKSGMEKSKKKDFLGAIEDFTKAIELTSDSSQNMAEIYFRRAVANFHIQNSEGSAHDLIKAGELDLKYNNQELFRNEF